MMADDVAERLRRWIANPLHYVRVSSNLTVVVIFGDDHRLSGRNISVVACLGMHLNLSHK